MDTPLHWLVVQNVRFCIYQELKVFDFYYDNHGTQLLTKFVKNVQRPRYI